MLSAERCAFSATLGLVDAIASHDTTHLLLLFEVHRLSVEGDNSKTDKERNPDH
jgi:hypothetical protein